MTLDHRFHLHNGEYLEAAEPEDGWIASRVIPGFRVRLDWLNPAALPVPADCLSEMVAG